MQTKVSIKKPTTDNTSTFFLLRFCLCFVINSSFNSSVLYSGWLPLHYLLQQILAFFKGNADSVRMFGTMMVSDHSKAEASLDSINTLFMISLPVTPDDEHIFKAAYLRNLSGYSFDTAYINAQVLDHQVTIVDFQKELSSGNDRFIKDYATSYLPVIQMHLQEALAIQAELK